MTYYNCRELILIKERKNTKTQEWIDDMKNKLDIFLLNNRLTEEEYNELMRMLDRPEGRPDLPEENPDTGVTE